MDKLIEVKNLKTYFYTAQGVVPAVDDVSFEIYNGETVCVVGESGCGKSVTAQSIMRIVAQPPGKYVAGEVLFEGRDLLKLSQKEMRMLRGKQLAMIFQEPMTSVNPVQTIGKQIGEVLLLHSDKSKSERKAAVLEILKQVGFPDPERCYQSFPHQLSGGMRQRAMIAMALICKPKLLIADEPTTALDVTIQAQILDLLETLKRQFHMTILMITHDLGVVSSMADRVVVMYSGKVVETGPANELFRRPLHPYTQCLMKCIPRIDEDKDDLTVISGNVPNPLHFPSGCRFHPRCPYAQEICKSSMPEIREIDGRQMRCHFVSEERRSSEEDRT